MHQLAVDALDAPARADVCHVADRALDLVGFRPHDHVGAVKGAQRHLPPAVVVPHFQSVARLRRRRPGGARFGARATHARGKQRTGWGGKFEADS
eukprot:4801398-Prymnesium_polylepis.1